MANKEEIKMVNQFFESTGGRAIVKVISIENKTIMVYISGYQFILPITPQLLKKGLIEKGFLVEVERAENSIGISYNPCDDDAPIVETDGIYFVVTWRKKYYLITPTDCPFDKKPLLYELAQYKRGQLKRLIHYAKRFCGNLSAINPSVCFICAIPSMMDEPEKNILQTIT